MKRRIPLLSLFAILLAVCAGGDAFAKSMNKLRDLALYDYASTIHWSEFDKAQEFLDPEWRAAHPLSDLDMSRYKQVQVSGYDVRTSSYDADGSYNQVVEIRLVNVHTQTERVLTDHQHWRYDKASKHWWLTTGLPDLDATE
jgi:hypothetical protein